MILAYLSSRANIMLPRMKINNRPNTLAHYPDCPFFAVDLGLNPSCFVALLFALGLIFSKKIRKYEKSPIKPGPLFVDLYILENPCSSVSGKG